MTVVYKINGEEKIYNKGDIKFSYRDSSFPKDELLITAQFLCKKGSVPELQKIENMKFNVSEFSSWIF